QTSPTPSGSSSPRPPATSPVTTFRSTPAGTCNPGLAAGAPGVADRGERPRVRQPRRHGVMEGDVKLGPVGPDPGTDVGRTIRALGRVDVDAADDAAAAALQHRVGETLAPREVLGVPPQVAEV